MNYETKTHLILPFRGEWMVSNGGRDPETNNHIRPPESGPQNQLYAYDFRKKSTGKEEKLDEYEVYGAEVLAPGDGKVIQVINGSIDVLPGERDRSVGVGNTIIIDHKNGEYSMLCHFKYESINVKKGDSVKQGDLLGLCGNTGNSQQPHIHFNLQDGPLMHKSGPLPAQFDKIMVNGEEKEKCEPIRGQIVANI